MINRLGLFVVALIALGWARPVAAAEPSSPAAADFFESQVRPVLAANCFECHGPKKQESDLRLDSREAMLIGNSDGPVIVPGDADRSRLVKAIRRQGEIKMPPETKLTAPAVEALTTWIKAGAPWPEQKVDAAAPTVAEAIAAAAKRHWAFQPVREPPLPTVKNKAWVKNPVDAFVLARLAAAHIPPAPPADRRTLIRRATFDLIGLPPTPADVEDFVRDDSHDAFARVVDRLLDSPRYGERWGRYWLDVARYADTKGYVFMEERKYLYAYVYRDWVIQAFNDDLPYDSFLIDQIAADRLPANDNGSLAAMGFLTVGRRFLNSRPDIIDDRLDVISRGTMGLTVTCARCHNHKFDPIPTEDYYSLYGVLASSVEKTVPLAPQSPEQAMVLEDSPTPDDPHVFIRGNSGNPGPAVPRQFLAVLSGPDRKPFEQGSGRLELAERIASPDNPLTARVLVNRVWLHHFGEGLVRTPSDFGLRSDPPTHPELLDYLAARFTQEGWSVKKLHRLIMLSSAYQQSSNGSADGPKSDPENRLLWKMNRRRLDFEATRDSLLAAGGDMDFKIGGPSIDLLAQPFTRRRSVYGFIDRQNLPGLFRTFDLATPDTTSPQRHTTTVPQQALYLMNSPFVVEQAQRLAKRPEIARVADSAERVQRLYSLLFGRPAKAEELSLADQFLASKDDAAEGPSKLNPFERYVQALLMTNEFVYID
ncbi:MAG TPA: PSD1 and planctomycete cytochrome C domain-containing protein [Pirellulales bacterium]|nr:PSD1 and planctomycete cytochrome C domain-containing protein [Pirellulales bacterium]